MPQYRFGDFTVDTDTVEVIGPDGARDLERPAVVDEYRCHFLRGSRGECHRVIAECEQFAAAGGYERSGLETRKLEFANHARRPAVHELE